MEEDCVGDRELCRRTKEGCAENREYCVGGLRTAV
jgi:hypothetical protein